MSSSGRRRPGRASLATFVQALEGQRVVVELRHDAIVRGTLLTVDDALNLQLGEASVQPLQGPRRAMEFIYLRGRSVRFIHLPGNLDPAGAIEAHRKRVAAAVRAHAQQQAQGVQRMEKGAQLDFGGGGGGGTDTT